jgi:transcriptional regulator with XRE-family HTH domain
MSRPDIPPLPSLLSSARLALGASQEKFGTLLGVTRKTAARIETGQSLLSDGKFHTLARAVYPVDKALATQLAAAGYATLAEIGIVEAPVPLQKTAPAHVLGHALVCAAAEALDASPRAMRPVLVAAFQVAKDLGLTVEEALQTLAEAKPQTSPKAR